MAIPRSMAHKQNLLHLLISFNVPFVPSMLPSPFISATGLSPHNSHAGWRWFLSGSRCDGCFIVLLASFCQLAKNTIRKFNPKNKLISKWPFMISFDHLFAEDSPRIFHQNNLSCLPSSLKFQIALPALRSLSSTLIMWRLSTLRHSALLIAAPHQSLIHYGKLNVMEAFVIKPANLLKFRGNTSHNQS